MNVAFFIYRRPDLTARVFEAIAAARPERLLIVADGPKDEADRERCEPTRAIVERVDWPCDVRRDYAPANLGCKRRVASGLAWVFGQVEEAVILEDDCLPHPTFFPFCAELLERFRKDKRVGHIAGNNLLPDPGAACSYSFSRHPRIWGWASWRRAWREYDVDMRAWPDLRDRGGVRPLCQTDAEARYFLDAWEDLYRGRVDTWDGQWNFAQRLHGRLTVVPAVNLVANIGFRADATHTTDHRLPYAAVPAAAMAFPMRHPLSVAADAAADQRFVELVYPLHRPWTQRLWWRLTNKHWYGRWLRRLPLAGRLWARLRSRRRP